METIVFNSYRDYYEYLYIHNKSPSCNDYQVIVLYDNGYLRIRKVFKNKKLVYGEHFHPDGYLYSINLGKDEIAFFRDGRVRICSTVKTIDEWLLCLHDILGKWGYSEVEIIRYESTLKQNINFVNKICVYFQKGWDINKVPQWIGSHMSFCIDGHVTLPDYIVPKRGSCEVSVYKDGYIISDYLYHNAIMQKSTHYQNGEVRS